MGEKKTMYFENKAKEIYRYVKICNDKGLACRHIASYLEVEYERGVAETREHMTERTANILERMASKTEKTIKKMHPFARRIQKL